MIHGTSKRKFAELTKFYLLQADICETAAKTATLANVRDRAVRSEAAWREMAVLAAAQEMTRAKADGESVADLA